MLAEREPWKKLIILWWIGEGNLRGLGHRPVFIPLGCLGTTVAQYSRWKRLARHPLTGKSMLWETLTCLLIPLRVFWA